MPQRTHPPASLPMPKLPAPITKVPHELLSDILAHTISPVEAMTISSLDSRAAPWIYTRVSRQFRAVALQTSMIWSSIYVPAFPDPKDEGDSARPFHSQSSMLNRLSAQLTLAKNQPLKICLGSPGQVSTGITPVLPVLWPHREYWEKFIFHGLLDLQPELSKLLPDTETAFFPRLKHLSTPMNDDERALWRHFMHLDAPPGFSSFGDMSVVRYQENMRIFQDAPSLIFLEMGPTPNLLEGATYPLSWTRCPHVVMHCLFTRDAAKILPLMDKVETLSIQYDPVFGPLTDPDFPKPIPLCAMTCLTTLSIIDHCPLKTLSVLIAPSLIDLTLSYMNDDDISEWRSFIARSGCRLVSLRIDHCRINNYPSLLSAVPDLLTLHIVLKTLDALDNLIETLECSDRISGQEDNLALTKPRYAPHLLTTQVLLDSQIIDLREVLAQGNRRFAQLASMRSGWTRVHGTSSAFAQEALLQNQRPDFSIAQDMQAGDSLRALEVLLEEYEAIS